MTIKTMDGSLVGLTTDLKAKLRVQIQIYKAKEALQFLDSKL